ncbi:lathosterol oxidase [Myotis myotis]|uniref:Sterol-C5-desaturase n=1 Tax=Myotis myotis TaxID=51298 RepID=A0A7J7S2Z0_MYOMY|nr:lathosterol oxidase [Myotis myotis]KAF6282771.1 sterol-C5-desaturase [Myotis myotis]
MRSAAARAATELPGAEMDLVLSAADRYVFTPYIYPATWPEDNFFRQTLSLLIVTNLGAYILYFVFATLSYYFIFDHSLMKHPQFLKNQVYREIMFTVQALPWMSIPTVALFLLELRGHSKLYDDVGGFPSGWFHLIVSVLSFLFFTDMLIYWIHRGLHHRLVYKHIHKPHHIWKIPTPFASHAFHPVDGFLQSLPYHIYPFIFPLHKVVYLGLYILVNIWTISIHDGDFRVPQILRPFINGSAHHTDHHMFFDYNYGQYFTLWDRIGGSFKNPSSFEGKGPLSYVKKMMEEKCSSHAGSACQDGKSLLREFTKTE